MQIDAQHPLLLASGSPRRLRLLERVGVPLVVRVVEVDFEAEAKLDIDIRPPVWTPQREPGPQRILLTGATGFLGAFLVDQLLRQTDATVVCGKVTV